MIAIDREERHAHQLIKVVGEVDASTSIELDNTLKEASQVEKNILIDLSGLDYISSAGLGVFISYLDELKNNNIQMVIFSLQPKVDEVFKILGLQHLMSIVNDEEEALKILND